MTEITNILGYWLRRAELANAEVFLRHFSELDLSMLQYGILIVVNEKPGIAQKELAQALGAKPSVIVKPLDRLERRGLIVRKRAAPDRRLQSVKLTATGKRLAARADTKTRKAQALLLRDIEHDDQKFLMECLGKIVRNVEQMGDTRKNG